MNLLAVNPFSPPRLASGINCFQKQPLLQRFQKALSVILNNWNGDGLKPPGFLTKASIKGKWPGDWGFTANRSADGIKPGRNKERKP